MARAKRSDGVASRTIPVFAIDVPEPVALILLAIESDTKKWYNWALETYYAAYDEHIAPINKRIQIIVRGKLTSRRSRKKRPPEMFWEKIGATDKEFGMKRRMKRGLKALKKQNKQLYKEHASALTFMGQSKEMTRLGKSDPSFKNYLRTWKENGGLDSFFANLESFLELRTIRHDPDAKTASREGRKDGLFYKIAGRNMFFAKRNRWQTCFDVVKVPGENGPLQDGKGVKFRFECVIKLGPVGKEAGHETLVCQIPQYQQKLIQDLGDIKFKKFEITRKRINEDGNVDLDKRERDLQKPGKFALSLTYDIAKPAPCKKDAANTAVLVLGGGACVLVYCNGTHRVLMRPVSMKFYMGKIDVLKKQLAQHAEGLPEHTRILAKINKLYAKMARKNKVAVHRLVRQLVRRYTRKMRRRYPYRQRRLVSSILGSKIRHLLVVSSYGPDDAQKGVIGLNIRSKKGKAADKGKAERSGVLGANQRVMGDSCHRLVMELGRELELMGGTMAPVPLPKLNRNEWWTTRVDASMDGKEVAKRLTQRKIIFGRKALENFLRECQSN